MTYRFSPKSIRNLEQCDPRLQQIAKIAIKRVDFAVICGHRGEAEQNAAFNDRPQRSKVQFPNSKHNSKPSLAFDLFPAPYDWEDMEAFKRFGAFILGVAAGLGYDLVWGGDWDNDWDITDNRFNDLPHFELTTKEGS